MIKSFGKWLVCIPAAGLLLLAGCDGHKGETKKEELRKVTGVTLQTVAASNMADQVEAVGTVRARNSSVIAARIPGMVSSVQVKEGDRVPRGKLLLTLEAAETTAGAAGAQAGVEQARRGVEEARTRKQLVDTTFDRYQKLFKEQAVTRQEFDGRQAEKDMAAQGLARAEAALVQAGEGARAAGTMAGYTRITSPLSGIVTGKSVDVGMTVFPGTPLVTVEEEGRYRLEAAAPESLLGKVTPGQMVNVVVDGINGNVQGRVAEVVPTSDPASRTFIIKVDIAAKGLRSGTYGKAQFQSGTRTALLLPKVAVLERGALTSVWVVDKERIARMRLVKTGRQTGDQVEIISGLSAGENVVTVGVEKVVEGAKVE